MTSRFTRRGAVIAAMSLGVAATSLMIRPMRRIRPLSRSDFDAAVPQQLGPYRVVANTGLFVPPGDELSRQLYDQVMTRMYAKPNGPPIMLLLAYGSIQNLAVELHRPEICYPEQGFSLLPPVAVPVVPGDPRIRATMRSARREGYHEQVFYWTRIGTAYPVSEYGEKLAVARADLSGAMPDGMLVRISIASADPVAALAQMLDFAASFLSGLTARGRQLVLGDG